MFMPPITGALALAALTGCALAQLQLTSINFPAANSTLTPGTNITVEIGLGDYSQGLDLLVLVIGLQNCYENVCYPASSEMGNVLYQGPFNPDKYTYTYYNYYQDFNVTIPESFPTGLASLTILNSYLVGEANAPSTEYLNLNVTVV